MRLLSQAALTLVLLICSPLSARAESSVGKALKLTEGLELKILELRRTKEQSVMFRYSLTNSTTKSLSGDALGFHNNYDSGGASGVSFIDMQGRKTFRCMQINQNCVGSKGTSLEPGSTKEFWMYVTEPPAATSSVFLQVGDYVPQPVTIDPVQ